jgi:uncharacterized protein YukE
MIGPIRAEEAPMSIEVDIEGVRGAGGDACALAGRLRDARSEWDDATRAGASACGLPIVRGAFRMLQDAWFVEVGAHASVLEQLCHALRDSAQTYQHTDQRAAQTYQVTDNGQ